MGSGEGHLIIIIIIILVRGHFGSYTQAPRTCVQTLLHILLKAALHSLHSPHSLNFGEHEMENIFAGCVVRVVRH